MAAKNQINVKAFDELSKQVSLVYDKLSALDTKLDGSLLKKFSDLAKGVNQFSNAFLNLKGVDAGEITKSLQKIQTIFVEIDKFAQQIQQSSALEGTSLVRFANSLYRFMLAVQDSANLDTNIGNLAAVPIALDAFAKSFNSSLTAQLVTVSDTIGNLTKVIRSISKIVPEIKALDSLVLGDALTSPFVVWIRDFQVAVNGLNTLKLPTARLNSLFTVLKSLQQFSDVLKSSTFDQTGLNNLTAFIGSLIAAFEQMAKAFGEKSAGGIAGVLGQTQSLQKSLAFVPDLIKSLSTLLADIKNIPSIEQSTGALNSVLTFLGAIQAFVGQLYNSVGAVKQPSGSLISRVVDGWVASVTNLKPIVLVTEVLATIGNLTTLNPETIKSIADVFRNISELMSSLFAIFEKSSALSFGGLISSTLANFTLFRTFMNSFLAVFNSIGGLLSSANRIPTESLQALATIITGFSTSLQGIIKAFDLIDGLFKGQSFLESIKNVAARLIVLRLYIGQIGAAIQGLLRGTKDFDAGQIGAVGSLLKGLGSVLGNLTDFFKLLSSPNFLPDLSLIEVVKKIAKVAIGLTPLIGVMTILRPVFTASKDVDLNAVAAFTKAVGGVLKAVSEIMANIRLIPFEGIASAIKTSFSLGRLIAPIRNLITSFGKGVPKNVELGSVKGYLDAIINFAEFAIKNLKQSSLEGFDKLKTTLSTVFNALAVPLPRNLVNAIKQSDKFAAFSTGLKTLLDVAKSIGGAASTPAANLKAFSVDSIEALGKYARQLINEFKSFSIADVERISKIAESLKKVDIGGGGSSTGGGVADNIVGKNGASIGEIRGLVIQVFALQAAFEGLKRVFSVFSPSNIISTFETLDRFGRQIERTMIDVATSITSLGSNVRMFGVDIVQNAGLQLLTQTDIFKATAEFDKLGSSLEVFGGLTATQRKEAEAFANQIGKDYPLSANEALAATLDLVKAGQSLENTKFILPAAADLAALSDSGSIEAATGTLIQAAASFERFDADTEGGFENIDVAANTISAAADVSTASIESLSEGLANAGPVANQYGLTLQETTASLAVLDAAGIKAAEGGTQLRTILGALASNTGRAELQRLGVAFTDAEGNIRDFNDILVDVDNALGKAGRTEEQNAASLKALGGAYGQTGLGALLAADGIGSTLNAMDGVAPAADRAKAALDNFSGDVVQLQGSLETLGTKALLPLLDKIFRPLVQIARGFVDAILSMDASVLEFITTALTLGSALITVIGGVIAITGAIVQLGGAVLTAFAYLATSGIPLLVTGFLAGLVGFVTGIVALAASFAVLAPILGAITIAFDTLYKIFTENRGGATDQFKNFATQISRALGDIGEAIGKVLQFIGAIFSGGAVGTLDDLGAVFANFFSNLSLGVGRLRDSGFVKAISDVGDLFGAFYDTLTLGSRQTEADAALAKAYDDVDSVREIPGEIRNARARVSTEYAAMVTNLIKSNGILASILGPENLTVENVQKYLQKAVDFVGEIRSATSRVFGSFGNAFADAKQVLADGGGIGEALNTFVTQLGTNLDDTIGGLAATVLRAIGGLFNLKTNALADTFDRKGFGAGVGALIQKGLDSAVQFLIKNRSGIKDVLTSLFDFFILGGLREVSNIFNLLGASGLSDALDGIIEFARGLFGGIIDTIFNLISGDDLGTALLKAFGPGIIPILNLVKSLGEAASNIGAAIGKIFEALFPPGAEGAAPPPLIDTINNVVRGITSFVDFLNDNVLSFLAAGDITGLIDNLVASLVTTVQGLDIPGKFASLANTLFEGFKSALKTAFVFVGNVFGFDGAAILTQLDTELSTALRGVDPSSALGTVKAAFDELIVVIGDLFGGPDGLSIFDNIKTAVDNFANAFTTLFAALTGPGAEGAKANGPTLTTIIQGFIDLAGNIVGSVVSSVADFARGLNDFAAALASFSPAEILNLTVILGALGATIAVMNAGGILAVVANGFTLLKTGITGLANSVIAKAAALLVFLEFFRSIAQNITGFTDAFKALGKLDIAGFIGGLGDTIVNTFVDFSFNLAELLGIDEIFGFTRGEFHKIASMIKIVMGEAALQITSDFSGVFDELLTITIPLLASELERLRLSAKAVLGDAVAQSQLEAFQGADAFAGKAKFQAAEGELGFSFDQFDGGEILNNFLNAMEQSGPLVTDRFRLQVARNFDTIFQQAAVDYAANADADPVTRNALIDGMSRFFTLSGQQGQAAGQALATGNTAFFNDLIGSMISTGATAADFGPEFQTQIAEAITANFNALDLDSANASLAQLQTSIDVLTALEIDTTYLEEQKAALQARLDGVVDEALTPVDTTVDVDATVGDTTVTGTEKVGDAVDNAVNPDGTPRIVDVPVSVRPNFTKLDQADQDQVVTPEGQLQNATQQTIPGFDTSALTNPDQVSAFDTLVTTLTTNVKTLATELNGLTSTQTVVTTTLGVIETTIIAFRDMTVPMFGEVKTAVDPIPTGLAAISTALLLLTVEFPILAVSAVGSMAAIGLGLLTMSTAFGLTVPTAIKQVKDLTAALLDAAAAAASLGGGITITVSGLGGGGGVGAGRANGGMVVPGLLYPFLEKNQPELLTIGNNTYLATPQTGMVTPLQGLTTSQSTGLYSGAYSGRGTNSAAPVSNTTVGDTIINFGDITTPAGLDAKAFVKTISEVVSKKLDENSANLGRKLRSNQR